MKYLSKLTSLLTLLLFVSVTAFAGIGTTRPSTDDDVRTIKIKGTNQLKFDVTEITAAPGEQIRIVFTVVGKLPKTAMAHNVVVLEQDTDVMAFVNASAMARDNQYIAPEFEDQIIAATDLAGGGETVEVTFTVPEKTGEYEYICSFPGHYMAGMKGVLTVQNETS